MFQNFAQIGVVNMFYPNPSLSPCHIGKHTTDPKLKIFLLSEYMKHTWYYGSYYN